MGFLPSPRDIYVFPNINTGWRCNFLPFPVATDLCLGMPCKAIFCHSPSGRWFLLLVREGSQKQLCLLSASQQHLVMMCPSAALRWALSVLLLCFWYFLWAPDGGLWKDLKNGYLVPSCGKFPGSLNLHVNPHSLFKNLLTFWLSSLFLLLWLSLFLLSLLKAKQLVCPFCPWMSFYPWNSVPLAELQSQTSQGH